MNHATEDVLLDASGLRCPLPLLQTKQALVTLNPGQILCVVATDSGALRDIPLFAQHAGHVLLAQKEQEGRYYFWLQHGLKSVGKINE